MSGLSLNVLTLFTPADKVPGTGLKEVISLAEAEFTQEELVPLLPEIIPSLFGLFGDYPNSTDKAPSAVFVAVFAILGLAHLYVFLKNYSRGHHFWISFGLAWYAFFRVIGFGLRIKWASNVLLLNLGLSSVVFSQVSVLYINVLSMILGHRIFTWRHPETGNSKFFNFMISLIYILVVGIVVMAIVGQALPYLRFMGQSQLDACRKVVKAAAILNLLYAMAAIGLVMLAFVFKPGTIDHRVLRMPKMTAKDVLPPTIQASWIESTGLFYYPAKGSQIKIFKGSQLAKAIRIIPSREAPASGLSQSHTPEHPNGPSITTSVLLVLLIAGIMTMDVCFRVAACFQVGTRGGAPGQSMTFWVDHNYVFYIWYGATEALVNVIILLARIDLRFYIPDMASRRGPNDPIDVDHNEYALEEPQQEFKQAASGTDNYSVESEQRAQHLADMTQ